MYKLPMSKYKNAAPKLIKREQVLTGISTNRLSNTIGSLISCNLKNITFALDSTSGGSICTFRHDDFLKRHTYNNDLFCVTHAHNGPITDIQYNTFNQSILATCGFDSNIQLWSVNDEPDMPQVQLNSLATIPLNENRSDCIQWNPNVDNIFVSTSLSTIYLWDVQEKATNLQTLRGHTEAIQGLTWKRDGSLLCTTAKDKTMLIIDPRNVNTGQNLKIENSKTANKDSKVVWLGQSDCILSSVYTQSFQREIHLWDIRNTSSPVHESQIDTGNNVLSPLYDYDTSVLFLVGKAETLVRYCEVLGNDSALSFTCNSTQSVDDQIKGVCLMPKFGLDLMKCEIDRLVLLTRSAIYPLPYHIPRRSYYDFHTDVFPDTYNIYEAGIDKNEWVTGQNANPVKIPLNPDTQRKYFIGSLSLAEAQTPQVVQVPIKVQEQATPTSSVGVSTLISSINKTSQSNESLTSASKRTNDTSNKENTSNATSSATTPAPAVVQFRQAPAQRKEVLSTPNSNTNLAERKLKSKSVYYQSKFKYIDGKAAHKNEHITNIRNLSTMWPSECNGFQVNSKHAAFLLSGSSGQLGIVELNKPGRLTDSTINSIVNKSKVSDFQWDPFNDETLAVACDDGTIKIWSIPDTGLESSLEDPNVELRGHLERLYCISYHPYSKNVLASASYDRTIKLWNIDTRQAVKTLRGHTDVIFSMSWSPCGKKLATICKDGLIRVYEPLSSEEPVLEAKVGPAPGSKAARVEWVFDGQSLLVSGFGRGNLRQLYLLESDSLNLLQSEDINQSPSLLIPYYDSDINVLYLYAKGEETVYLFEILDSEPYFQALTPFKPDGLHFAIAFLPKIYCDIKSAEIGKAYRLTKDSRIEKMSFIVPRVKLGFFQDDIYPNTLDRRTPYLTAEAWFNMEEFEFRYLSLQPDDMQKLTEMLAIEQAAQPPKPARADNKKTSSDSNKGDLYDPQNLNSEERKIISSMLQRATLFYKEKSDDEDNADWS